MSTGPASNRPSSKKPGSGVKKPGSESPARQPSGTKPPPAAKETPVTKKSPTRVGLGMLVTVIAIGGFIAMLAGVKIPNKGNPEYVTWIGMFVALLMGVANILIGLGFEIDSKKK